MFCGCVYAFGGYVWGLDLSGTMQGAGSVGGLLAVTRVSASNVQTFFTCYDGNGSITEYVDESGSVRAHYEYDAFGNIIAVSGDLAETFTHRFSTKPFDAETGLVMYQLRPYAPPSGRWFTRDPIEERGGINLYGFCKNSPINNLDYLGEKIRDNVIKKGRSNNTVVDEYYARGYNDFEYFDADGVKSLKLLGGFADIDFNLSLSCQADCGGSACSRPVIGRDTVLTGVVYWNNEVKTKTRAGFGAKEHEMEHYYIAKINAELADHLLHKLADGKCVATTCCEAKSHYLNKLVEFFKASQTYQDAQFDAAEYGGGGNLEKWRAERAKKREESVSAGKDMHRICGGQ